MTDKILIDRAVVEQALEAFKAWDARGRLRVMAALSAALEQPQDHFPNAGNRVPTGWKLVPVEPTKDMKAAGAFAAMDQVRRSYNPPSAYIPVDSMALLSYRAMIAAAPQPPVVKDSLTVGQPQPPQQPLTDGEILMALDAADIPDLPRDFKDVDIDIARAIERAHGIGE